MRKRIACLCLVCLLFLSALLSGCGGSDPSPDLRIVGRWRLDCQWRTIGQSYIDFYDDYTFEVNDYLGTWEIAGDTVTWAFAYGTTYTGTIDAAGTAMSGTCFASGVFDGDWTAARVYVTEDEVIGTWTLNYKWGSAAYYLSDTITLSADGTFSTGSSLQGTWSLTGDAIQWIYSSETNVTYNGLVKSSGDGMFGTCASNTGGTGQWYATKNAE